MNYPKIGEKFYYEDLYGKVQEATCLDVSDDNYYIEVSKNYRRFVDKDDILDEKSEAVIKYQIMKARENVKTVAELIKDKDTRELMFFTLVERGFTRNEANKALDSLSKTITLF